MSWCCLQLGLRSQDVIDCEWAREEPTVWKRRRVEAAEGKEDYSDEEEATDDARQGTEEEDKVAAVLQQEETRHDSLAAANAPLEVIKIGFVNVTVRHHGDHSAARLALTPCMRYQSGKQMVVSASRAARLEAVFSKLAIRSGIPRHSLRFMFDGLPLSSEDTPVTVSATQR
jgi:hypothetical protein